MIDRFGRNINYLRLSVTEKCQLHCRYCRDGCEEYCSNELSADELLQIARVCVSLGIAKIRLTGGEPLIRRDIITIAENIGNLSGLKELTVTTNGQTLESCAADLYKAGVKRINISLDSLDSDRYRDITGGDISNVFRGIEKAKKVGINPIKINVVLIKGVNDEEVGDFLRFSRDCNVQVRFIEIMPLGSFADRPELRMTMKELLAENPDLVPTGKLSGPARLFDYAGGEIVGIIAPMSEPFCCECNKIRILSDGTLRPCLGCRDEISLREFLGGKDETLACKIADSIYNKPMKYIMKDCEKPLRNMSRIGG